MMTQLTDTIWTLKFMWCYFVWDRIPVGTKSVLFGAHCFFLHPFFVAAAWRKLYGFPFDPRLWVAFFVHDLGYFGMPNMDGPEGEKHCEWGATVMHLLFDSGWHTTTGEWHKFSLYHSRHYAKQAGAKPSRLCFADKLAFCYQIKPLYLLMTGFTGELDEYLTNAKYWNKAGVYEKALDRANASQWYDDLCVWVRRYVDEHKDGAEDTVTVDRRVSDTVY